MKHLIAGTFSFPPIAGFAKGITVTPADPAVGLSSVVTNIVTFITIFAGFAFLVYFLIGALGWITSGGKSDQLEKAKSQMGSALIGLLIVILVIPITYILSQLTGIEILNPALIFPQITPL